MLYKNRFCFRIAKEAGVGVDKATNEPSEAYIQMFVDTQRYATQKVKDKIAVELKDGVVEQLKISPDYVTQITAIEYDAKADKKPE